MRRQWTKRAIAASTRGRVVGIPNYIMPRANDGAASLVFERTGLHHQLLERHREYSQAFENRRKEIFVKYLRQLEDQSVYILREA